MFFSPYPIFFPKIVYNEIMRCPRGDNLLVSRTPSIESGLTLHYLFCPSCGGHWLSAFDANYLKSIDLPTTGPSGSLTPFSTKCPQCRKDLERTTEDNIPPDVTAFRCPDGHGYFFPAGELLKFKVAQETKVTYHKLWNVPLASVASALLATFFGLVLSTGLIIGVIEGQRQQTVTSQAKEVIASQKAYVDSQNQSVTIIALTTEKVTITVVVDGQKYPMLAPDARLPARQGKSHVVRIEKITPGDHRYFFRFQKEGKVLQSSVYSFSSF